MTSGRGPKREELGKDYKYMGRHQHPDQDIHTDGRFTQKLTLVASQPSLFGSRRPDVKRNPALWSLIMAIAKRDTHTIEAALESDHSNTPQKAQDDSILDLVRLSKHLPDHPILYALDQANQRPPIDSGVDYLYYLIQHRAEIAALTPNPDSDEAIKNFASSLNPNLSSLVAFALNDTKSEETPTAVPAA